MMNTKGFNYNIHYQYMYVCLFLYRGCHVQAHAREANKLSFKASIISMLILMVKNHPITNQMNNFEISLMWNMRKENLDSISTVTEAVERLLSYSYGINSNC